MHVVASFLIVTGNLLCCKIMSDQHYPYSSKKAFKMICMLVTYFCFSFHLKMITAMTINMMTIFATTSAIITIVVFDSSAGPVNYYH